MRKATFLAAAAGLFGLSGTPAAAQLSFSGEAEIVSDYRYRGVSLSNDQPALQASAEVETKAGFYLGGFASWVPHGGGPAAVELDAIGGYRTAIAGGLTLDGNLAWYHYPSLSGGDYGEATASLGWERGATSARAGIAWAPRQANLVDSTGAPRDNLYGFAGIEHAIAGTPLSLHVEAGYEAGAFAGAVRGGKLDWRAGASVSAGGFALSASYVGALRPRAGDAELRRERGLVLALGRSF
jgi:uncharacterized protein (TIGR02001 family)